MSDAKRRYQAIREGLEQVYPTKPNGVVSRHLNVLAAMISGIIGAKSTSLPAIADYCSFEAVVESRVKRLSRWIKDNVVTLETYFMPFANALIAALAPGGITLVIDGSCVGRGCVALMVGIVFKKRALPIAWIVAKGSKGHFPEAMHIDLIRKVKTMVPEGCKVTLLGDGEFDGVHLQALVSEW